jgi:hypothetical protein
MEGVNCLAVKRQIKVKSFHDGCAAGMERTEKNLGQTIMVARFFWYIIPKAEKMYQMNTRCTKWS